MTVNTQRDKPLPLPQPGVHAWVVGGVRGCTGASRLVQAGLVCGTVLWRDVGRLLLRLGEVR